KSEPATQINKSSPALIGVIVYWEIRAEGEDKNQADPEVVARVKSEVLALCANFPVYDYAD
ncbi:MAG: hypothetical protein AAF431_19275, partial [Pseudomonadota bacterium]